MSEALSSPRNRLRTFVFLVSCILLAIAAAFVGIEDNPPGIFLAFLATIAFVLTFVHSWRTSKQFLRLLFTSVVGLVVFGALYIGLDISISNLEGTGLMRDLLGALSALLFAVLLVCPAGLLVGGIGALVMVIRNRQPPKPS